MVKKIIILIVLFFYSNLFSQVDLKQQVDINYTNISLEEFLQKMESDFELSFTYGKLEIDNTIDFKFKGELIDALESFFSEYHINYKTTDDHIILKLSNIKNLRGAISGKIVDQDSKVSVLGASFVVLNKEPLTGTASDIDGYFSLENLPIGRYDFIIKSIGYEPKIINQIEINSVKEKFLEIDLIPAISSVDEVIVYSKHNKYEAINEMAMASSSRSFSIEETQRYPVSISDPSRMVQNYAGVSLGNDDLRNDIVIRGNSPRGMLWMLEGVEIPNPNHFGEMGSKGGVINILSSTVLTNSDFYTSSFPAQYGNAISGIFDMKLKKGNNTKREHVLKVNSNGIELTTEGFFFRKSKASYIVNYRFSNIQVLNKISKYFDEGPSFRDVTFKIHLPFKKLGSFSVFSVNSENFNYSVGISPIWDKYNDIDYNEERGINIMGLNHKFLFNEKTLIKTIFAFSTNRQIWKIRNLKNLLDYEGDPILADVDFFDSNLTFSSTVNYRYSPKHLFQFGLITTRKLIKYQLFMNKNDEKHSIDEINTTFFVQNFTQWKYRINSKWTSNIGYHFSHIFLNNSFSLNPRFGLNYKKNKKVSFSSYVGIHTRPEHLASYLVESKKLNEEGFDVEINKNLKMTKSLHTVLSYNYRFAKDFNFKSEIYYQYLFHVPVINDINSDFSSLNSDNIFNLFEENNLIGKELVNKGTGHNYGIDLTIEKFFSNKYYFMLTSSLFDSYYSTLSGEMYRTKYANNFLFNIVGGKEFRVGKNKNNVVSLNSKIIFNGGKRYTPIDIEKSIMAEKKIEFENMNYTERFEPYYRFDIGTSFKINRKKTKHTFSFDIKNISSHKNAREMRFDIFADDLNIEYHSGFKMYTTYILDFAFKVKKKRKFMY